MITPETLQTWQSLAAQLKSVKKMEMDARKEIIAEVLGINKVGTKHAVYGETEVHVSATASLSLDDADVRAVMATLSPEERECIVWKPSLKKREYDALPDDNQLKVIVKLKVNTGTVSVNKLELVNGN